jgi:hypothetical protein
MLFAVFVGVFVIIWSILAKILPSKYKWIIFSVAVLGAFSSAPFLNATIDRQIFRHSFSGEIKLSASVFKLPLGVSADKYCTPRFVYKDSEQAMGASLHNGALYCGRFWDLTAKNDPMIPYKKIDGAVIYWVGPSREIIDTLGMDPIDHINR